jgi:hypothetical protein
MLKFKITEKLPPQSNEQLAVKFSADAESYAGAALSLQDGKFHGPMYFLFCHAFELILKAYVLSSGGDQSELRDIGHDLDVALKRAFVLGYAPKHPDVADLMEWLNPYHKFHDFRYAKGGPQILPTAKAMFVIFEAMHQEVSPLARAAYLKNPPAN